MGGASPPFSLCDFVTTPHHLHLRFQRNLVQGVSGDGFVTKAGRGGVFKKEARGVAKLGRKTSLWRGRFLTPTLAETKRNAPSVPFGFCLSWGRKTAPKKVPLPRPPPRAGK